MLTLLLCVLLSGPSQESASLPAWITTLHSYEQRYGRDSWSFGQLMQARASMIDPRWSNSSHPAWWIELYRWYLEYYPVLFLLLTLAGCVTCFWCYWRNHLCSAWLLALLWLVLGICGWYLLHPPSGPCIVTKQPSLVVRTGNGFSYPQLTVNDTPVWLGAGVEGQFRSERSNGWVQIQLNHNILGWVPRDAVYIIHQQ